MLSSIVAVRYIGYTGYISSIELQCNGSIIYRAYIIIAYSDIYISSDNSIDRISTLTIYILDGDIIICLHHLMRNLLIDYSTWAVSLRHSTLSSYCPYSIDLFWFTTKVPLLWLLVSHFG